MSYSTGIHITYIYCVSCLQCSINRSYDSIPSNKWVALTRAGLCAVCVVNYPANTSNLFLQSSAATPFRRGDRVYAKFRQDSVHHKLLNRFIFAELFKIWKGGGRFLRQCSYQSRDRNLSKSICYSLTQNPKSFAALIDSRHDFAACRWQLQPWITAQN